MPVIRVSEATWGRLKKQARPFEDTPDDVIARALDALDAARDGDVPVTTVLKQDSLPERRLRINQRKAGLRARKIQHWEFREPLLETIRELGGGAETGQIRRHLEKRIVNIFGPRLNEAEYALVSSGQPRWWNAVCWERKRLVDDGVLKPGTDRGVWELVEHA